MASIQTIRERTWLNLNSDIAQAAGMSLQQLQQFAGGAYHPSDPQIRILARLMKFTETDIACLTK